MKKALIVFVKAPVPGKVKTRLQPCLSPETITEIYKGNKQIFRMYTNKRG
jgi:glycosyltransferase A (GT-A) superfamily protein (DUF2064 family)